MKKNNPKIFKYLLLLIIFIILNPFKIECGIKYFGEYKVIRNELGTDCNYLYIYYKNEDSISLLLKI